MKKSGPDPDRSNFLSPAARIRLWMRRTNRYWRLLPDGGAPLEELPGEALELGGAAGGAEATLGFSAGADVPELAAGLSEIGSEARRQCPSKKAPLSTASVA